MLITHESTALHSHLLISRIPLPPIIRYTTLWNLCSLCFTRASNDFDTTTYKWFWLYAENCGTWEEERIQNWEPLFLKTLWLGSLGWKFVIITRYLNKIFFCNWVVADLTRQQAARQQEDICWLPPPSKTVPLSPLHPFHIQIEEHTSSLEGDAPISTF